MAEHIFFLVKPDSRVFTPPLFQDVLRIDFLPLRAHSRRRRLQKGAAVDHVQVVPAPDRGLGIAALHLYRNRHLLAGHGGLLAMSRLLTFSPSSGAVAPTRSAPPFVRILRLLDAARLDFLTSSNEIHIGEEADR